MSYSCDQNYESGSQCSFSCPEPLRLNGTHQTTCDDGTWSEPAPFCCMGKLKTSSLILHHRRHIATNNNQCGHVWCIDYIWLCNTRQETVKLNLTLNIHCSGSGCPADFKLDLFFVVDASSSIGEENFEIVRRFLKSLALYFNVGQDTVRIGMISFNRKVTNILKLAGQLYLFEEFRQYINTLFRCE